MSTQSTYMNFTIPGVGIDFGPAWATEITVALQVLDAHTHSPGNGNQIGASGLDIQSSLTLNNNSLTQSASVQFNQQVSAFPSSVTNAIYSVGGNLYFNNQLGQQVQITNGSGIAGTSGSISGITGTASVSYYSGTYTFASSTGIPANLSIASLFISNTSQPTKYVFVQLSNNSSSYSITLPSAPPSITSPLSMDPSGNLGFSVPNGTVPVGGIIAIGNNIAGAFAIPASGVVSQGWMVCDGSTIPPGQTLSGPLPQLTDDRFLMGTTGTSTGGNNSLYLNHSHIFPHTHMAASSGGSPENFWMQSSSDPTSTTISQTYSDTSLQAITINTDGSGNSYYPAAFFGAGRSFYTTGVISPPFGGAGATATTGTALSSPTSVIPQFFPVTYLIRVI